MIVFQKHREAKCQPVRISVENPERCRKLNSNSITGSTTDSIKESTTSIIINTEETTEESNINTDESTETASFPAIHGIRLLNETRLPKIGNDSQDSHSPDICQSSICKSEAFLIFENSHCIFIITLLLHFCNV